MKKNKLLYVVIIITFFSAAVFLNSLLRGYAYALDDIAPVRFMQENSNTSKSSSYPQRLLIPSLSIDTNVQQTGITKRGNIGTPTNYSDVAWYAYGTIPGQIGSAIIDGHIDNSFGLDGVFKHLTDILPGAKIYIVTKSGVRLQFIVTDSDIYDYKSVPIDKIFKEKDGVKLKLITCEGAWIPSEKTYDKRLIVTAVLKN